MSERRRNRREGAHERRKHARPAARSSAARPSGRSADRRSLFPVWAPLLVMIAVTITGLVLGMSENTVPETFFVLFAIAAIVCTILVEARGLFITVASLPLYFLLGTLFVGWFSAGSTGANSKKTKLITSIYPTVDHFMWLLIPFFIAVGIGIFRWWNYREKLGREQAKEALARRRRADADRKNRESYSRVHNRAVTGERGTSTSRSEWTPREQAQARAENPISRTRTVDELRASAQRRRMPLPERRSAPRNYISHDSEY
ncbi:DUF6542 domain-containing protein [Corynebacterium falsenii]|nr:DUF6542 domain-containing protein [Corynebacterium falsenii]